MLFIPSYGYFCWNKKTDNFSLIGNNSKHLVFGISTFVLTGIVQFMNYFIGNIYLINIFMSIALAILLFTIVYTGDSLIENAIKKSTIMTT